MNHHSAGTAKKEFLIPHLSATCRLLLLIAGFLLSATLLEARQEPSTLLNGRRNISAVRLDTGESIHLDGRLDEPGWQRALPAADFKQQEPDNGAPATERTEVRVVFDQHRLYLGVLCFDSQPSQVLANQMQRDQSLDSDDRFMWTIDTYLDARSGYYFEINPSGAMGDGLVGAGTDSLNRQWDGIWIARVRRSEVGWTAEIEIPFQTLNFDAGRTMWGINFQRTVRRKNEEAFWSGHARNQGLFRMASAGLLTDLSGISQGLGLDFKPYMIATGNEAPGRGDPGLRGDMNTGLDIFYNLTPSLRTNLTVNTDFAETEVDQRRVNLTRFPLFYPEKRDFFLEGSSFFDFSREPGNAIVPFFSRRIGIDASGTPQKIDWGLKLTGQVGAENIGFLHVRTGREDGVAGEDFTVARVKLRLFEQSYIGTIYTRRAERGGSADDLHSAGVDFHLVTSRFRKSQNLEFSGFLMWNSNPLGTGDNMAYGLRLNYPNDLWNTRVSFREVQRYHDPAIGFTQRAGYRRVNPVVRFSPRPRQHRYIRRLSFEVHLDLRTDSEAGSLLLSKWDLTVFQLDLHSGDEFQVHIISNFERLERNFQIQPGILLPVGSTYNFTRYRLEASTASRRTVAVQTQLEAGRFFSGDRRELGISVAIRPRRGVLVNLEGEWNRVALSEGKFETRLYRAVVNTQFSPWMSLVNHVQYDSVTDILGWQFRWRWIIRPGSDLYLVYMHNWQEAPLSGLMTLDRRAATKITYTHRF